MNVGEYGNTTLILPVGYFPPVDYFRLLVRETEVCVEAHEHFIKQTIRSRCEIFGANGRLRLSIPVRHENRWKIPLCEVRIDHDSSWQQQHWKSILSAYGQAAFFTYYRDSLEELFQSKKETLFEWNMECLRLTLHWLKSKTMIKPTTTFEDYSGKPFDRRRFFDEPQQSLPDPAYYQVFGERHGFQPGLSILDLILNTGPDALAYLQR